jgi:hypothetical protein
MLKKNLTPEFNGVRKKAFFLAEQHRVRHANTGNNMPSVKTRVVKRARLFWA